MIKQELTAQEKIWKLLTRFNHQLNDWDRYYIRIFQRELDKNGLWAYQYEALENVYYYHSTPGHSFSLNLQELDQNR